MNNSLNQNLIRSRWRNVPFILTAIFLLSCESRLKPAVSSDMPTGAPPSQESWGITVAFADSGRTRAVLRAGHVAVYPNTEITILNQGIKVDFFDREEHHTSVLTADSGQVDDRTHNLKAFGNVIVVSDSGVTLRTTELGWDNARRLIHTNSYVRITSPTEEIEGQGFESNESLTDYRIFHVTGRATVK